MIELCSECEEPTGRAGAGEDSLYSDDGETGPFCEGCFELRRDAEIRWHRKAGGIFGDG